MPCRLIDLSLPPYDEQTIESIHNSEGCPGVTAHFAGNPIDPGSCIEIDGKAYRVLAVRVKCENQAVYENGSPPPGSPPTETHGYIDSPVVIELWLEEIPQEELQNCQGTSAQ